MAKKKTTIKKKPVSNEIQLVRNEMMTVTREVLNRLRNTDQTDLDTACKYPVSLTITDYRTYYERMGLAKRAVQIWPDECWQSFPKVLEDKEIKETEFEGAWNELETKLSLFHYMHKIDVLSGIGRFGALLLGFDDGGKLDVPISGIDPVTGEVLEESKAKKRKILYLRAYDESVVTISASEQNPLSPRYGMPTIYNIKYQDEGATGKMTDIKVHWTRIIHVADNRECSEVLGVSRMQTIYNNLYDIKKVSGSSAEMFWKGGFPGYAFELTPEAIAMGAEIDTDSVKEQVELWEKGLQRFLALQGVTTKSLAQQVADPKGHVEVHLKLIALSLGVPYRVLLGSEEAKLASVQDKRTWNGRVAQRQSRYLSAMLVRPFIDRLLATGCLPMPKQYKVVWPDLNAATEDDITKIAMNRTKAFSDYVGGGVDNLIPPRQYFTQIHKMTDEEADAIIAEQEKYESELNPLGEEMEIAKMQADATAKAAAVKAKPMPAGQPAKPVNKPVSKPKVK